MKGSKRQFAPVLMDVCENCGRLRGQYGVLVMCPERESGVHAYTVAVEVVPRAVAEALAEALDGLGSGFWDVLPDDLYAAWDNYRAAYPKETP